MEVFFETVDQFASLERDEKKAYLEFYEDSSPESWSTLDIVSHNTLMYSRHSIFGLILSARID